MLPEVGAEIKIGDTYASLEAIKWSGHLTSPVSGIVVEVNEEVFNDPSLLNKDASLFLMKVKYSEIDELMSEDEMKKFYEV